MEEFLFITGDVLQVCIAFSIIIYAPLSSTRNRAFGIPFFCYRHVVVSENYFPFSTLDSHRLQELVLSLFLFFSGSYGVVLWYLKTLAVKLFFYIKSK